MNPIPLLALAISLGTSGVAMAQTAPGTPPPPAPTMDGAPPAGAQPGWRPGMPVRHDQAPPRGPALACAVRDGKFVTFLSTVHQRIDIRPEQDADWKRFASEVAAEIAPLGDDCDHPPMDLSQRHLPDRLGEMISAEHRRIEVLEHVRGSITWMYAKLDDAQRSSADDIMTHPMPAHVARPPALAPLQPPASPAAQPVPDVASSPVASPTAGPRLDTPAQSAPAADVSSAGKSR